MTKKCLHCPPSAFEDEKYDKEDMPDEFNYCPYCGIRLRDA